MDAKPKIYGDFQNVDDYRRIRLSVAGSQEDIASLGLTLKEGMEIEVTDTHSLSADGIVRFSIGENIWVAEIDWKNLKYLDE
jgi:hypothetical protein